MATKYCLLASASMAATLLLAGAAASLGEPRGAAERSPSPAPLASDAASTSADQPATAATASPIHFGTWGFDVSGVDAKAKPGDSFFEYANGLWDVRTTIPLDRSRFGVFDLLTDRTQDQLRAIIEDAARFDASPDTDAGKIGALYYSFMDEARIEMLDASPIATDLTEVRDAKTRSDLAVLMGRTKRRFGASLFFVGIGPDGKDPNRNTLSASQGGLGLPDRDYYLRDSFKDKKDKYRDYIARMPDMVGWSDGARRVAGGRRRAES
jgi:putative endopeptidase